MFLTITIPLLTSPPDSLFVDSDHNQKSFEFTFMFFCSCSIAGQLLTVVGALALITSMTKLVGEEASVYFIKRYINYYIAPIVIGIGSYYYYCYTSNMF